MTYLSVYRKRARGADYYQGNGASAVSYTHLDVYKRQQLTATIRDQTEVITPGITTVGTSTRETVIAGVIIEEVTLVNVMVIVTGEAKEEAIGETKMNIGPR